MHIVWWCFCIQDEFPFSCYFQPPGKLNLYLPAAIRSAPLGRRLMAYNPFVGHIQRKTASVNCDVAIGTAVVIFFCPGLCPGLINPLQNIAHSPFYIDLRQLKKMFDLRSDGVIRHSLILRSFYYLWSRPFYPAKTPYCPPC